MSTSTYSLQTSRDVIISTEIPNSYQSYDKVTTFQNVFQTLSNTNNLYRIIAKSIIMTRKPGSVWPLINSNLENSALHDTDYFMQVTIPNALRPLEIGNLNKSNVFIIIDLRELFDSYTPLKVTFADFRPIVYRFYQPAPEAYFADFTSSYSAMDVQFTNSLNVDHPILAYANFKIQCHIESINYALSSHH